MARRVLIAEFSGGRVRGRPRLGWMDGVKVALGNRGMTVEAARQCGKDRKEWRTLVHIRVSGFEQFCLSRDSGKKIALIPGSRDFPGIFIF